MIFLILVKKKDLKVHILASQNPKIGVYAPLLLEI